jgi:hypothetical protein
VLTYKSCLKNTVFIAIAFLFGEVSERFKELVLKTSDVERHRGFESHPLRHFEIGEVLKLAEEVPLLRV